VLSRLARHRIAPGETVADIAQQYGLIPATLLGLNPQLQGGSLPVGSEILIPPYNGTRIQPPAESTWQSLAETFGVRADALFEVNGCTLEVPEVVFVPGVNWSPAPGVQPGPPDAILSGYPLPEPVSVITRYGWQLDATTGQVGFHSGVDLDAPSGTAVLAAGSGVVAFAGEEGAFGNLVVINHAQGLQTRYGQLESIAVQPGQTVQVGDRIGTVGMTGNAQVSHLHFEVRLNSSLGWVAENPGRYFLTMARLN
jgi:murein DD-endopeptidase MepM/ murein hydrolase activator NlpD